VLEPCGSDWSAARAAGRSVSAGEIRRALSPAFRPRRDPPPIVNGDIFNAEDARSVVHCNVHVNWLARQIDQFGSRAPAGTSRCE